MYVQASQQIRNRPLVKALRCPRCEHVGWVPGAKHRLQNPVVVICGHCNYRMAKDAIERQINNWVERL